MLYDVRLVDGVILIDGEPASPLDILEMVEDYDEKLRACEHEYKELYSVNLKIIDENDMFKSAIYAIENVIELTEAFKEKV